MCWLLIAYLAFQDEPLLGEQLVEVSDESFTLMTASEKIAGLLPHKPRVEDVRQIALQTFHSYVSQHESIFDILREIAKVDHKLTVWCVCSCISTVFNLDEFHGIRDKIRLVHRWIHGAIRLEEIDLIRPDDYQRAFSETPQAGFYLRESLFAVIQDSYQMKTTMILVDLASAYYRIHTKTVNFQDWRELADIAYDRFKEVIKDAIATFPGDYPESVASTRSRI